MNDSGFVLPQAIDNQPHVSPALRRRIALELAVLAIGTPLFLAYASRDSALYVTMAALFVCFVAITARETRQKIWGEAPEPWSGRMRRSVLILTALTVPTALMFLAWNTWHGRPIAYGSMLLALGVYFAWACLQQIIFQFYLHGRLRVLWPSTASALLPVVNGAAYGLVHFPHYELMLLTTVAGIVWSFCYRRDRVLLPIAASHAILGTGYYYWIEGADLIQEMAARLAVV